MVNWHDIDTVLLDMDGTLLDLHFDNYFWLDYLPQRYAEHHQLEPVAARKQLLKQFRDKRGSLDWYCLDYWSQQLSINILALKEEIQQRIKERPHAFAFLQQLKIMGKQRRLVTNAHPHSLQLKLSLTRIGSELDDILSSHQLGVPKEAPQFWQQLQQQWRFDPQRTLFMDDSMAVLNAAEQFGIKHLCAISLPDCQQAQINTEHFPAIQHFAELLEPMKAIVNRSSNGENRG